MRATQHRRGRCRPRARMWRAESPDDPGSAPASCRACRRSRNGRGNGTTQTQWQATGARLVTHVLQCHPGCVTDLAAAAILSRIGTEARTFARNDLHESPTLDRFVSGLARVMQTAGYTQLDAPDGETNVVLHSMDAAAARPYRRKAAPTFVVAIAELPAPPDDILRAGYPLLVRGLANLCVMVSDTPDGLAVRFVTLEQGMYGVGPGLSDKELFERAFTRIEPLASSKLVIANEFVTDLPEHLWQGDDQTKQ